MGKDKSYAAVKALIEAGGVKKMRELFSYLIKSDIYPLLHIGYRALERKIDSPGLFTLDELYTLAQIIEVEKNAILEIAFKEMLQQKS